MEQSPDEGPALLAALATRNIRSRRKSFKGDMGASDAGEVIPAWTERKAHNPRQVMQDSHARQGAGAGPSGAQAAPERSSATAADAAAGAAGVQLMPQLGTGSGPGPHDGDEGRDNEPESSTESLSSRGGGRRGRGGADDDEDEDFDVDGEEDEDAMAAEGPGAGPSRGGGVGGGGRRPSMHGGGGGGGGGGAPLLDARALRELKASVPCRFAIHSSNGLFRGTFHLHEFLDGSAAASSNPHTRLRACVSQEGSSVRITPREAEKRGGKGARKSWKQTLLTSHGGKELSLQKYFTMLGLERAGQGLAGAAAPGFERHAQGQQRGSPQSEEHSEVVTNRYAWASAARSARSADEPQSKRQHLEAQLEASVRRRTDELGMSNNYGHHRHSITGAAPLLRELPAAPSAGFGGGGGGGGGGRSLLETLAELRGTQLPRELLLSSQHQQQHQHHQQQQQQQPVPLVLSSGQRPRASSASGASFGPVLNLAAAATAVASGAGAGMSALVVNRSSDSQLQQLRALEMRQQLGQLVGGGYLSGAGGLGLGGLTSSNVSHSGGRTSESGGLCWADGAQAAALLVQDNGGCLFPPQASGGPIDRLAPTASFGAWLGGGNTHTHSSLPSMLPGLSQGLTPRGGLPSASLSMPGSLGSLDLSTRLSGGMPSERYMQVDAPQLQGGAPRPRGPPRLSQNGGPMPGAFQHEGGLHAAAAANGGGGGGGSRSVSAPPGPGAPRRPNLSKVPLSIEIFTTDESVKGTLYLHEYVLGTEARPNRPPPCVVLSHADGQPASASRRARVTPREAEAKAGREARKNWKETFKTNHEGRIMSIKAFFAMKGIV